MKKKVEIREELILKLKNFEKEKLEKKRQTALILSNLIASDSFQRSKTIALYMPMPIEFDLSMLFQMDHRKKILIPKVLSEEEMIFVAYNEDELEPTKMGILEPKSEQAEVPDTIVVPGLAWNSDGYRIGFGAGYYDRYLKNFNARTLGCCYDLQKVEFEAEAHDIKVKEIFSV